MSECKYCHAAIKWDNRRPYNEDGTPHHCPQTTEEEKRRAAGFDNPVQPVPPKQETKKDCTSSQAPAASTPTPGLKTVEGQIVALDVGAHKVSLKDRAGEVHTFIWGPALHEKMSHLQQWWFAKLTGELVEDMDTWKLIAQDYFKRPEDWPASGGRGRSGFAPRTERLIAAENMLTNYTQLYTHSVNQDETDFDTARKSIMAAIEEDLPKLMKAGGA